MKKIIDRVKRMALDLKESGKSVPEMVQYLESKNALGEAYYNEFRSFFTKEEYYNDAIRMRYANLKDFEERHKVEGKS